MNYYTINIEYNIILLYVYLLLDAKLNYKYSILL